MYNVNRRPTESTDRSGSDVIRAPCDSTTSESYETSSPSSSLSGYNLQPREPPSYSKIDVNESDLKDTSNSVAHWGPAMPISQQRPITNFEISPDLARSPLRCLFANTLKEISMKLDPEQPVIKNWKDFAAEIGFTNDEVRMIDHCTRNGGNQSVYVIEKWISSANPTFGDFYDVLVNKLERFDVWTSLERNFENDVKKMRQNWEIKEQERRAQEQDFENAVSSSIFKKIDIKHESASSTTVDIRYTSMPTEVPLTRAPTQANQHLADKAFPTEKSNLEKNKIYGIKYDALLLFDNENKDFVPELIKNLEAENIKTCIPQRDIEAGDLEYPVLLEHMMVNSRKIVVVMSDEFFKNESCQWHLNLLIKNDPVARERKVIPVKYKKVTIPNILDHLSCCDLTKTMMPEWFWNKLYKSIKN